MNKPIIQGSKLNRSYQRKWYNSPELSLVNTAKKMPYSAQRLTSRAHTFFLVKCQFTLAFLLVGANNQHLVILTELSHEKS